MNYYERHIGDYLKDTAHLSLLEHGIYTRLLDVYYTRESAIPDEQVARLVGARTKDEKESLGMVLQEFFVLSANAWSQPRCERELARYLDKQLKAKRSADARWSAVRTQSDGNANASRTHMPAQSDGNALQSPVSSNQSPVTKEEKKSASAPPTPKKAVDRKTEISEDFAISERVETWAAKGGFTMLDQHLDAFTRKCKAKGYKNISWDDAFMEAIREDWAKLRGRVANGSAPPADHESADELESRAAIEKQAFSKGLDAWNAIDEQWPVYKARVLRAPRLPSMSLDRLAEMAQNRQGALA